MSKDLDQTFVKQRIGGEENYCEKRSEEIDNDNIYSVSFAKLDVESLLSRGPHFLREDHPESTDQQLYQRIRYLETLVTEQNEKLIDHEQTERNYFAALERLARKETENSVVVESREKYYNEAKFLRGQLEEKTAECDQLRARMREMTASMVLAITASRTSEERIKKLEKRLLQMEFVHRQPPANQPQHTGLRADMISSSTTEEDDSGIGIHVRPIPEKLPVKRWKRMFRSCPTVLPRCRNCNTVFDQLTPQDTSCRFHRASPQPLKTWQPQLENGFLALTNADTLPYKFWPCCEKVGMKEPPGCLRLKNHDIVYPEEE